MTRQEYLDSIDYARREAGYQYGWNVRFLHALDALGLELKPMDYQDPEGRDMTAPIPVAGERPTWPESKIGVKNY